MKLLFLLGMLVTVVFAGQSLKDDVVAISMKYPIDAAKHGIYGKVTMDVELNDGAALKPRNIKGNNLLATEAAANLSQWSFGKARGTLHVTYNFRFEDRSEMTYSLSRKNLVVEVVRKRPRLRKKI